MIGIWSSAPSLPYARRGLVCSGDRNGARATGGMDSNLLLSSSTFVFDGTAWSTSASMLTARAYHAGGGVSNAIVFGGESSSGKLVTTEKFTGTVWESSGSMITARSYFMGYGTSTDAIAAGGAGSSGILQSAEKFDGTTWTSIASLSSPKELGAACGNSSYAMCLGGFNGSTVLYHTEIYNGTTWASGGSMLMAKISFAAGGLVNASISFGGTNLSAEYFGDTEVFYGETFQSVGVMLLPRSDLGGDGVAGSAISSGGAQTSGCYTAVEIFVYDRELYYANALAKKTVSRQYLVGFFAANYERDTAFYKMAPTTLVKFESSIGFGAKVRSLPIARPVLDSIVKALAERIADIRVRLLTVDLSHKIDYATGSELDTRWGSIYNLPRYDGENDVQYRKRLKTFVLSQIGSGTLGTCKSVLDEVVGKENSTEISVYEPGKVYVRWNDADAIRFAYENQSLVDYALQKTLAAGIDWSIYYGIVDYSMKFAASGMDEISYPLNAGVMNIFTRGYTVTTPVAVMYDDTYDQDVVVCRAFDQGHLFDVIARLTADRVYDADVLFAARRLQSYYGDMLVSRLMHYSMLKDVLVQRTSDRRMYAAGLLMRERIMWLWAWTSVEKCVDCTYGSGVVLVPGSGDIDFHITVITSVDNQPVTITRLDVSQPITIYWGDGSSGTIPAGSNSLSHIYEDVGKYHIVITEAKNITALRLESDVFGNVNTYELRSSDINYFWLDNVRDCLIDTSDMVNWRPVSWRLSSLSGGSSSVNSAHMESWRPVYWSLGSMPEGSYSIDSSHMVNWRPDEWYLYSMPDGMYSIDCTHMEGWQATYWCMYDMPNREY